MDTLIHLLKGSLGTGILAMPNAFNHSGFVVGSIGTVVIGLICTYCIHLLIKAEYELCKRKKVIGQMCCTRARMRSVHAVALMRMNMNVI